MLSPLGTGSEPGWATAPPAFVDRTFTPASGQVAVAPLANSAEALLAPLRHEPELRGLDRAALLGIAAARLARQHAGWDVAPSLVPTGVAVGSSRGATGRLEADLGIFHHTGRTASVTSPLTTPGHLASVVGRDFAGAVGAVIGQSSTCSSALQAVGTAVAWLRAGLAERFLAGGTEAPLTPFTVAQMRAVGIYSPLAAEALPCRPFGLGEPANTFVLGEGAALFALERAVPRRGDVVIAGIGFGFERAASRTGITPEGQHLQQAMQQALALAGLAPTDLDAIILHAPGTAAGDAAELAAVRAVCGAHHPELLVPKWQLGHALGASGALGVALAHWLLTTPGAQPRPLAYASRLLLESGRAPAAHRAVLINAAGFGGGAASVLLRRVD